MDMKSSHLDGVAGQALVDPVFHVAAQRLVREPSQSIGQDNEQGEQPQQPQPTPAYRQRHGRLLSLDTQTSYLKSMGSARGEHGECQGIAISKKRWLHRHFPSAMAPAMKRQCYMSPGKNFTF